ncbi:MAG: substrate-binding domain-containing protein [Acidobacteriaceae bacterium]|nr:substrate-binding domain-containing protein [Acidobacteriaceae bacterium]
MTKYAFLFLTTAAGILLTGCAHGPHDQNETYVLVAANTKIWYWQTVAQGLNRAASEMKVKSEVVGPDRYDPPAERTALLNVLQEKPAGIMISPATANLFTNDINTALQQGIPVITIDSDDPLSKRLFFIGTDNYNAGRLGGQLLAKELSGKGNVVMFTYPNQLNLRERQQGYLSVLDNYPAIKLTQAIDIKGDPSVASDTAKTLLESKVKVDAFVCLEATACPAIGDLVSRSNMTGKVAIIAMDTDQRTLTWIQKGVIAATIAQRPYTMAYFATKVLDQIHHNPPPSLMEDLAKNSYSPLPWFIDTGTFIVDKDNVNAYLQQNQAHAPAQ